MNYSPITANFVIVNSRARGMRSGQVLFNLLPNGASIVVIEHRHIDPHSMHLTRWEVEEWIENHLIFDDDGNIIAVLDGDDVIWELYPPDMSVPAIVRS